MNHEQPAPPLVDIDNKVFTNYIILNKTRHGISSDTAPGRVVFLYPFPIIPEQKNRLGSFLPMIFHLMRILHKNQVCQTDLLQFLRSQPLIKPKDMGLSKWP